MSRTAPPSQQKRKVENGMRGRVERPRKRSRRQLEYHSSSDDSEDEQGQFAAVNLDDTDDEQNDEKNHTSQVPTAASGPVSQAAEPEASGSGEEGGNSDTDGTDESSPENPDGTRRRPGSKRNDPAAFSTSISRILSTKLSQSARKDPVLARSREAAEASVSLANERTEKRAKAKLRADRKEELERGRITDVLGLDSGESGAIAAEEKRLRKVAQRGVIQLFNAVRAAQVKADQAEKEERRRGTVGMANREERVTEISKQGFMDLIGGKKRSLGVSDP